MPDEQPRRIAIACQGGGSHTAFTAGALARLLRSDDLRGTEIVGLSGTSGGAICALLAWAGLREHPAEKGAEKAAALLEAFWWDNSARDPMSRMQNVGMVAAGLLQGLGLLPGTSPYVVPEPLSGVRQFRELLSRHVEFDGIDVDTEAAHPMLLLGAVDVVTGRFRAFNSRTDRITADTVLASAAIPTLFRAVHTHGGAYWDGLFSQNPPVRDLLATDPDELWVIQINPLEIDHEPRTLIEISDRRNALAGNLSLYQELGFIETIDQMLADGALAPDRGYRHTTVRIMEMPGGREARLLGPASKLNRDVRFLRGLQSDGARQAGRFLAALRFERAVREHDPAALAAATADDAVLRAVAPFSDLPSGVLLREHAGAVVDGGFRIDPTRKHVAGRRARWTLRLDGGGLGMAEVAFSGDCVASVSLGPVPD